MPMLRCSRTAAFCLAAAAACLAGTAAAVQVCDLDGQPVNPNNGNTTEGKSGLMRCRDGEGGPVLREQELQKGKFMGVVRHFRNGVLEKEYRVNERGNREGLSREWSAPAGGGKPALLREETLRDGTTFGLVRSWYPSGQLRRVTFYGDASREEAYAEFTVQGRLNELHCAKRPLLGPDFDDAAACGHAGKVQEVVLYGGKEQPRAKVSYERGERRRLESLWELGSTREVEEAGAAEATSRSFAADGTKRREVHWQIVAGERPRRVMTLDQEFHESGKLVRERRWRVGERGGELAAEATWYLNGQPKQRDDYVAESGKTLRRQTGFHDNGAKAFEGSWVVASGSSRYDETALGTHRSYDPEGRLRSERVYDARGRIARERELDERGTVIRDDEVFEDGSRKAVGR